MDEIFQLTRVDPVTGIAEPIPAKDRIERILDHPQAPNVIRAMDAQALYSLVHEAGLNDGLELVLYASPEQVQAIVDFDCWTRDDFEIDRFGTWLEVMLQREDEDFDRLLDEMDFETFVMWIREHVAIFLWEDDLDTLDTIEDPVVTSPDGKYALVIPAEEKVGPLVRLFLERVYAKDVLAGHRLLEAARWELTSDLQEMAYSVREARLGDLGFVPFHEALEVYAVLDPVQWSAKARATAMSPAAEPIILSDGAQLPPVDHQIQVLETRRFSEHSSAFTRAMGALPMAFDEALLGDVVDSLLAQFRALVNRVHIADLGSPGDMGAARAAADRADAYLSIGLELVAREDMFTAARVLATTPLKSIHRAGYSATTKLASQARALVERGNLTLVDGALSLLDARDADLIDGLLARRPTLSGTYDTPFESMSDVEEAARRLGEIAFTELLFYGTFRHTRAELAELVFDASRCATSPDQATFRCLFATRVLGELQKTGRELAPLSLSELHAILAELASLDDAHTRLMSTGIRLISDRNSDTQRLSALATAYSARVAGWLLDELGDLDRPVPMEIANQLVLVAPS
jgi:hypothetical protein